MKVVIIDHEPYSEGRKKSYFIEEFQSNNIAVEFWDLSKATAYSKAVAYSHGQDSDFVSKLQDIDSAVSLINKIDGHHTIVICEILLTASTLPIFQALYKNSIKWVKFHYYLNPTNILESIGKTHIQAFKLLQPKKLVSKFRSLLFKRHDHLSIPDIAFVTGADRNNLKAKRIVSIDYFDVGIFKNMEQKAGADKVAEPPYIVFLDIMLPYHPDFKMWGIQSVSSDVYFHKMNSFFSLLEKEMKMPVVIAAHPKSNYTDEYGGRKTFRNKTAELIVHSNLVLTHGSFSISFALMAEKPLVYLYFDAFKEIRHLNRYWERMNNAGEMLDARVINIDAYSEDSVYPDTINKQKYNEFLHRVYLKEGNIGKSNFEVVFTEFKNLLKEEL